MREIDLLTVFFAAIIYFIIYTVWYSKFLFKKIYQVDKPKKKKKEKRSFFSYFLTFILILISAYFLASFETIMSVTTFKDGLVLGFLIWLGFIATHSLFYTIRYKRDLKLYILDNILYLLGLMIMGGIIAG